MFSGFRDDTVEFFMDLKFNNDPVFFRQQHDRYLQVVQQPFYDLITALAPLMVSIDSEMEVRPYKCLSHIHRDTRFTKDKSPYRDHLWFLFRRGGEPREKALNFFVEFGPGTLGWGMGFWGENREALDVFRKRLVSEPDACGRLLQGLNLQKHQLALEGSLHKRIEIPKALPPELKTWYCLREVWICKQKPDYALAFTDGLLPTIWSDFEALAPLYRLWRGFCDELTQRG